MECIICGSVESTIVSKKDNYDMVKCAKCGLVHVEPMPTTIEIRTLHERNRIAQNLVEDAENAFNKSFFFKRFEVYKEIILRYSIGQNKMLGIGESSNELLSILKKNEFEVYGVELCGKLDKVVNDQFEIQMFSEELLDVETDLKFDFISAINIIEFFPEPSKIMKKISKLLNDRGYLLLEVLNYNSTESMLNHFLFDETLDYTFHSGSKVNLWEFDKNTIRMFMENNGFEVIELKTISPDDLIDHGTLKEDSKFSEVLDNKDWIWLLARKKGERIDFKGNEAKEDIKFLIELGQLNLAKKFAKEFREKSPSDIEIYSIEAVAEMMCGNLDNAYKLLLQGLKINNKDSDLNYNLAYLYELKELYLKALETYEDMAFNMGDTSERREIIKLINKLEVEHRDQIQIQLEQNEKKDYKVRLDGKTKNLHLVYDSIYCNNFIHFVNEHFPNEEHEFIIIGNSDQKMRFMNIEDSENVFIIDLRSELNQFLDHIKNSSRIFVHYLFDYFCRIVCHFQIETPIYWILWGGDLTNYIDLDLFEPATKQLLIKLGYNVSGKINREDINFIYRKAAYRKISYWLSYYPVGHHGNGEYDLLKENFITACKPIRFAYQNKVVYTKLADKNKNGKFSFLKRKYNCVILAGNSGNPTNNHLDLFYKLKKLDEGDFCVVVPLSYGGTDIYLNEVIRVGKELFEDRFIAITEYIEWEEYLKLLSVVNIGLFNHNRQQGFGTMLLLLGLGKTVYAKYNKTVNDVLVSLNVNNFYPISRLNKDSIRTSRLNVNCDFETRIEEAYGDEAIKKYFADILEGTYN